MVMIKLLLYRNKPKIAFLSEQENEIVLLFPGHVVHHEEFDIKPAFAEKGCILKAILVRNKITLLIDSEENLKQHAFEQIPFVLLGDGDFLLKVGNAMDGRKVKELDPFKRKKRGMGGLFGDDDDDDDFGRFGHGKGFFSDDEDRHKDDDLFGNDDDKDKPVKT